MIYHGCSRNYVALFGIWSVVSNETIRRGGGFIAPFGVLPGRVKITTRNWEKALFSSFRVEHVNVRFFPYLFPPKFEEFPTRFGYGY